MAEYVNIEKPFLDKLHQPGWEVIGLSSFSRLHNALSSNMAIRLSVYRQPAIPNLLLQ